MFHKKNPTGIAYPSRAPRFVPFVLGLWMGSAFHICLVSCVFVCLFLFFVLLYVLVLCLIFNVVFVSVLSIFDSSFFFSKVYLDILTAQQICFFLSRWNIEFVELHASIEGFDLQLSFSGNSFPQFKRLQSFPKYNKSDKNSL